MYSYKEITENIFIEVEPIFIPERSVPYSNCYLYAYTVKIENLSDLPCQLLRRYWVIRDGKGHEEKISGEGVVGKKPMIAPGGSFQYTSFCPLPTPTGNMRGSYELRSDDGSVFHVNIPVFFLRQPHTFH